MLYSWNSSIFVLVIAAIAALMAYFFVHALDLPVWIEGIRAKTYLVLICFLLIMILLLFVWWIVYLPSPRRWYLTCARACLFVFVSSALIILSDVGMKFFNAQVRDLMAISTAFEDRGTERFLVLLVSIIALDVFSRKYAKFR